MEVLLIMMTDIAAYDDEDDAAYDVDDDTGDAEDGGDT